MPRGKRSKPVTGGPPSSRPPTKAVLEAGPANEAELEQIVRKVIGATQQLKAAHPDLPLPRMEEIEAHIHSEYQKLTGKALPADGMPDLTPLVQAELVAPKAAAGEAPAPVAEPAPVPVAAKPKKAKGAKAEKPVAAKPGKPIVSKEGTDADLEEWLQSQGVDSKNDAEMANESLKKQLQEMATEKRRAGMKERPSIEEQQARIAAEEAVVDAELQAYDKANPEGPPAARSVSLEADEAVAKFKDARTVKLRSGATVRLDAKQPLTKPKAKDFFSEDEEPEMTRLLRGADGREIDPELVAEIHDGQGRPIWRSGGAKRGPTPLSGETEAGSLAPAVREPVVLPPHAYPKTGGYGQQQMRKVGPLAGEVVPERALITAAEAAKLRAAPEGVLAGLGAAHTDAIAAREAKAAAEKTAVEEAVTRNNGLMKEVGAGAKKGFGLLKGGLLAADVYFAGRGILDVAKAVKGVDEKQEIERESRSMMRALLQRAGEDRKAEAEMRIQDLVQRRAALVQERDPGLNQIMLGLPELSPSEALIGARPQPWRRDATLLADGVRDGSLISAMNDLAATGSTATAFQGA